MISSVVNSCLNVLVKKYLSRKIRCLYFACHMREKEKKNLLLKKNRTQAVTFSDYSNFFSVPLLCSAAEHSASSVLQSRESVYSLVQTLLVMHGQRYRRTVRTVLECSLCLAQLAGS